MSEGVIFCGAIDLSNWREGVFLGKRDLVSRPEIEAKNWKL